MKFSFTNKIRAILALLFFISLLEAVVIFQIVGSSNLDSQVIRNLQNTAILSSFVIFILAILLFFYIPVFLQKVLKKIHELIHEISLGNYQLNLDLQQYEESMDKEFYQIILSLSEMLKYVLRFDNLKKAKVLEQKKRIDAILDLSTNGFLVLQSKGEIVFANEVISEYFPSIVSGINVLDKNFHQDVEASIKKYCFLVLTEKSKQENKQFFIPALKRHITLKSSMVKNMEGNVIGAVICVSNLIISKKKTEKGKEN